MTIFYLLRHGQTYANQKGILQGCLNTSLTCLLYTSDAADE